MLDHNYRFNFVSALEGRTKSMAKMDGDLPSGSAPYVHVQNIWPYMRTLAILKCLMLDTISRIEP